jgi:SAM-dependent methyltransferase
MTSRWQLALMAFAHPRFWLGTALSFVSPRLVGTAAVVGRKRPTGYDANRDRNPVRQRHNRHTGWEAEESADGLLRRNYASYEEYVVHQQQKLDEIVKAHGGFSRKTILFFRLRFFSRFRVLRRLLPKEAVVVCAGAREGTEVAVLRELGFAKAYGIDLNPGEENKLVQKGDFMNLENSDASVDLFYSNCADHAFDLEAFFAEHARVVKRDGYAIYEFSISGGHRGAFESVMWKREEDIVLMALKYFKHLVRAERDSHWLWIMLRSPLPAAEKGAQAVKLKEFA